MMREVKSQVASLSSHQWTGLSGYFLLLVATIFLHGAVNAAENFDHEHTLWNEVLQEYVQETEFSSTVRYAALKKTPEKLLQYLQKVSAVSQKQYDDWSSDKQLSFLINAYNALTLKLVIDNYPVESIKDIGNIFRSSWKMEFFSLLGKKSHLDYVEHELIRHTGNFREPRIHFALVCASIGCPKLQAKAFTDSNLEQMLSHGTQAFLRDKSRNYYDEKNEVLRLSSIFKWYGDDFEKNSGTVYSFVSKYVSQDPGIRQKIRNKRVDIEYLDYDWALNDARKPAEE